MRAFLVLSFLCLLAGCTRPAPPAGTLRVGLGAQPTTLDPHLAQGLAELRVLSSIYEGLVLPFADDKGNAVSPGIAQRWETSPNGLNVTFHLRAAVWSNGEPITAQGFIDSWQRAMSPSLGAPNAALFDAIAGAKDFRQGKGPWQRVGLRALDAQTLEVRLARPSPNFLSTLGHPVFYPLHHASTLPPTRGVIWATGKTISNGAFQFVEQRPYEKIIVEKNPRYWSAPIVQLRRIEFYPIDNRASEETAFLSGALDVTMSLPLSKVEAYARDPRRRVDPALQVGYLVVNVTRPPLNDVNVRRLLSLSLERRNLCEKILRGGQTSAFRFVPPLVSNGSADNFLLTEDAVAAHALFQKLSPAQRQELQKLVLRFNTSEARRLLSEALQAQWQKTLGVNITLENLEWKTFLAARQKGDFDLAQAGWSADFADPANFLELFVSDNPNNVTGWKNASYDAVVAARNFTEAEKILLAELPVIPLYFNPNIYLLSPRVTGWQGHPMDFHDWRKITVR